LPKKF